MNKHVSKLFITTALAAGLMTMIPCVFAGQIADDELRTQLLNTLDNLEATATGLNISTVMGDKFEYARGRILSADSTELGAIPSSVHSNMRTLEVSTGQMRMMYDPALWSSKNANSVKLNKFGQGAKIQSSGADYSSDGLSITYPDLSWTFAFEGGGEPEEDDSTGGSGGGICNFPGTSVETRFITLNVAIVFEAIKDMAEQACGQDVLGVNVSLACLVTDIAYFVAKGADENQSLCNEHMGASEISATWEGLKTVHSNVQHVHDDLATVDADLAAHDTDIKLQVSTHDTNINTQLSTHDTDIKSQVAIHDGDIKQQVAVHDTDIKLQLAIHDADIKARLGEIQGTVDENQRLLKVSMTRQAEIMRLLITASGQREINPDVLSCTGPDCPPIDEVLSCNRGGLAWPCK